MGSWEGVLEQSINGVLESEVNRLVNEIAWIDGRIADLGDGEEDLVEKKLLKILRRHLMRDLYEIVGFVWEGESGESESVEIASVEGVGRAEAST
jgi:hypothetical protein